MTTTKRQSAQLPTLCQVLIVAPNARQNYEKFILEFEKAFENHRKPLDFKVLTALAELEPYLARHNTPHVIILDGSSAATPPIATLKITFENLRALDAKICILVLYDALGSSGDTMTWLDAGATAVLQKNFSARQMGDGLRELLSRRLNFDMPRVASEPRSPLLRLVTVKFSSLQQAIASETLNIGIGGFFLRSAPSGINVGESLNFEFRGTRYLLASESGIRMPPPEMDDTSNSFVNRDPLVDKMNESEESSTPKDPFDGLQGSGTVVWVRTLADHNGPEGIGVQFRKISGEAEALIEQYVAQHRIRTFVPKG